MTRITAINYELSRCTVSPTVRNHSALLYLVFNEGRLQFELHTITETLTSTKKKILLPYEFHSSLKLTSADCCAVYMRGAGMC